MIKLGLKLDKKFEKEITQEFFWKNNPEIFNIRKRQIYQNWANNDMNKVKREIYKIYPFKISYYGWMLAVAGHHIKKGFKTENSMNTTVLDYKLLAGLRDHFLQKLNNKPLHLGHSHLL